MISIELYIYTYTYIYIYTYIHIYTYIILYIYVHGIARKHQLELQCSCQERLEADTPAKKKSQESRFRADT